MFNCDFYIRPGSFAPKLPDLLYYAGGRLIRCTGGKLLQDYSRRDALQALGKFSTFASVTGIVILSAEDVVAQGAPVSCYRDCNEMFLPGRARRRCRRQCREDDALNALINDP